MMHKLLVAACVTLFASAGVAADKKADAKSDPAKITYDDHIQPFFRSKCFNCHNQNKKSGGLDLTNYTALMQGGSSGEVVAPGSASDSYLYSLVTHETEPYMPPNSEVLPKANLELIRKWIDGGALENFGSKVVKKKGFDLTLKAAPTGKPAGPPPMPGRLSLQPVTRTAKTTAIPSLATNPWSPLVAVAGQKQILLYHSGSLKLLGVLPFPEGVPHILKFSRNGQLLLAGGGRGSYKGKVVVWNVKTGQRVVEVGDELDSVLAADISSDHTQIALGGPSKLIRIYSTTDGKLLHEIKKHTDWIYSVEFSPDGVLLATADRNGGMFVWEAQTAREYLALNGHRGAIKDVSWRLDSNILASCSEDGTIKLWEMENGRQVKNWGAHGGGAASVEFTRDGNLVSCGRDRVTKLWNQNGGQIRPFAAFGDLALACTYCDETKRVIAGDFSGEIRVWNSADGKQLGSISVNPPAIAERIEAANKTLAPAKAENDKLAAAYKAAQDAATKIQNDLNAAKKTQADATAKMQAALKAAAGYKSAVAKLTAESTAAAKAAATLAAIVTPLTEAVAKADQALAKNPADKALAAPVAQLKAVLAQKNAELAAAKKTQADKAAAAQTATTQLAAAEKSAATEKAAADAAAKQVAALTPQLKPALDKAAAAKKALDAAAAKLAAASQELAHWQQALETEKKLVQLAERRTAADQLELAAQTAAAELKKHQAAVAAAQANAAAVMKQYDAKVAVATVAKTTADKAAAELKQATDRSTKLTTAVPMLQDALAKAQQAVKTVTGDKELAAAAAQLKAVVDRNVKALAEAKQTVSTQQKAATDSAAALAAAQKAIEPTQSAVGIAQKQVATATTALQVAEKKSQEATAALAAARKEVESLQAVLNADPADNTRASK